MIVYEVNLSVNKEHKLEFSKWLNEHIQFMLKISGFKSAQWFVCDQDNIDSNTISWCVQYILNDRESLDSYFKQHASRMREDGLKKFPGLFTANRRVFTLIKDY